MIAKQSPINSRLKFGRKEAAWRCAHNALSTCLLESLSLVSSIPSEDDVETVHEARVKARRARLALRLLNGLPRVEHRQLDAELRWLGALLGAVRDMDVEIARTQEDISELSRETGFEDYRSYLSALRGPAYANLVAARRSARYQRLVSLTHELTSVDISNGHSGRLAYKRVLRRLSRQVVVKARGLDQQAFPEQWHQLRIRVRRLRYAFEALQPATDERYATPRRAATRVQSVLGDLQDRTSGLLTLADYSRNLRGAENMEAVAELVQLRVGARDRLAGNALTTLKPLKKSLKESGLV